MRRPQRSATIPVGISKSTMPAVKEALAANASKFVSPASSRKIVLIPQIRDAARGVPAVSTYYVRRSVAEVCFTPQTLIVAADEAALSLFEHVPLGLWNLVP